MELRCDERILFGILDGGLIEVKCKSHRCGAGEGVVVLHRFSMTTGKLVTTSKYKNPRKGHS